MDLQVVSQLSALMVDLERQIEESEQALSALKEKHRVLKEESIPMSMQELGLESITLSSGEKLTVTQEVYASIPVANRPQAYAWLEEHGFGGLIKTEIGVQFGKGEMERAQEVVALLQGQGINAELSQNVHAQTLKAFIKDELSKGSDIPLDLFGARPTWSTKIKAAKK